MSQSASTAEDVPDLESARQAHLDMTAMMREGRSFSGRERNCVFLNTGQASADTPRFADISASSGVDMPDDGRGVAVVDWDADGDLDMWISNRNAPRIRLLRNQTPGHGQSGHGHYVALRLVGNGTNTNRDAIGARVAVYLDNAPDNPLLRTLRAGDGFLSQSSKWLHFGLGEADRVARVVVRWPSTDGLSGKTEEFTGVSIDGRFRLVQGRSSAEAVAPRTDTIALAAGAPELPPPSDTVRAPSISLYRVPKFEFAHPRLAQPLVTGQGKAVLLNLWGSWCRPCREEIREFTQRSKELREAGIEIVALSVDDLDKEFGNVEAAKAFIINAGFPFVARSATELELRLFHDYDNLLTTRNGPLPIPSSFLIDQQGHLAVIYKGRVTVDQLLLDVNYSRRSLSERWLAAAPLPGSLVDHEAVAATARVVEATAMFRHGAAMLQGGRLADAAHHLYQTTRFRPDFAEAYDYLGNALGGLGRVQEARTALERAIALDPGMASAHYHLAMVHLQPGAIVPAVSSLRAAIRIDPEGTFARTDLTHMLAQEAKSEQMLKFTINTMNLHRRVAWLMATSPDESLRNGPEAVRWAKRLVEATQRSKPGPLWTLAAAYAQEQRFDEAIAVVSEARQAVENFNIKPEHKKIMLQRLDSYLQHYQQGRPYRESPVTATPTTATPATAPPAATPNP